MKRPFTMCRNVKQTLAELDCDRGTTYSLRKVMCHLFHVSEPTVSRYLSGQQDLEIDQIAALSRYLLDEYDETRLAKCFTGTRYDLHPRLNSFTNGQISDDITRHMEAVGDVIRCYNNGEKGPAKSAWHNGTESWANVLGEIERL